MRTFLMVIQVIVSLILIGSILLQTDKDAGLSGTFVGAKEQAWGKHGRGFEGALNRVTSIAATLFIILAIALVAIQ